MYWLATENDRLGKQSAVMARAAWAGGSLAASAISFWELALLIAKGRLEPSGDLEELRGALLATGFIEIPLDGPIAILAMRLQGLHKDPADRFIAATAMRFEATLITADARLLRWRQGLKRQNATR